MSDGMNVDVPVSWEGDNQESILPPDYNNPIYQSLSDRTKQSLEEIGQDVKEMYNALEQVTNLLNGSVSEEDYLKHFYGQYRPNKCKFLRGI